MLTSEGSDRLQFTLHTDGGCSPNPGPGGWAFVLEHDGTLTEQFGGEPKSTNNRMELTAVIRGFEAALEVSGGGSPAIELIGDSQYVLKGLTEWMPGWKANNWTRKVSGSRKPVLNEDLWRQLDSLKSEFELTVTWVKGHSGHPSNERCDVLVKDGIRSIGGTVA